MREIARQSGLTIGTIRQEAEKLQRLSLILKRKDGNRSYYRANKQHPLCDLINKMVLRTVGVIGVLEKELKKFDLEFAFIFGSVASGKNRLESDIDLFLIGNTSLRAVSATVSKVSLEINREINAHVMKAEEFRRRQLEAEHFVTRVLETPILMILGKEDELRNMA
ncbi:MAG TPA: nucleotidyltransferase domain-containing protein [Candidatus Rifleibacterium sp.]|nr:nucleotidyltransferase domain-containing protein [Candidatus Rifleibacterium sp.]HPT46208.1 nucleotidyltransferase domain-containing protein [Candidatus Rifleibacterium sp.]